MYQKRILFMTLTTVFVLLLTLFLYRVLTVQDVVIESVPKEILKVYEAVPITKQTDFKLLGDEIYVGSGFEPGFTFKINLAGTKFGTEIVSQYGETKYVGYIDLESQSTSTKIFSGKLLDKTDKVVDVVINIDAKKCTNAKGDEVPYTANIKVSKESLTGCADLK